MISYITVSPTGQIYSCGYVQKAVIDQVFIPSGATLITGIMLSDPSKFYWDGSSVQEIPESPSPEHIFSYTDRAWIISEAAVKRKRDGLLKESDWTQFADVPEATRLLWQPYRQALRDITLQDFYPDKVEWPNAPV